MHDRPECWACERKNWPDDLRPQPLPSQSTISRRSKTVEVLRLLAEIERLQPSHPLELALTIDGKPLLVGSHSKDPDALWGHVRRGWAKGYKLHAIFGLGDIPSQWDVAPLNEAEPTVGSRLVGRLGPGGCYLLGDSAYDSNPLHDVVRGGGRQLLAPCKKPGTGLGHCYQSPGRLRSIDVLETNNEFARTLFAERDDIERRFGRLTNHAAGLAPLPNWVRRLDRVRLWVQLKLLIHAAYVLLKPRPPPIAVA